MRRFVSFMIIVGCWTASIQAREWSDLSGNYHITADLVARTETMVVLEKANKELVGIQIKQLSKKDQKFLAGQQQEAEKDPAMQDWTMRSGLKIRGAAVEYTRKNVVIRRRRGKIYVNDQRFDNLPGVYRKMIPMIVSEFEKVNLENEKQFRDWVRGLNGATKTYSCDGVMLELENGDLYAVPFFFFSEDDRKVLEPGWEAWAKLKEDDDTREQHALSLQAQSIANRQADDEARQVQMLSLQLQGYQAGLFALWEVALFPPPNVRGFPVSVVVPARNSTQARVAAKARYPNYRVGPVGKVSRK